jgi:hypothetical protein
MQNELSPQAAKKKAMLMAQLDSLTEDQLPREVDPDFFKHALTLHESFDRLAFNNKGLAITETITESIHVLTDAEDGSMFHDDIIRLARLQAFMIANIDILKKHTEN